MKIKFYGESNGACFGKLYGDCSVLIERHSNCGTYYCPFYKPKDCEDWIRIDKRNYVLMLPPEELDYVYAKR